MGACVCLRYFYIIVRDFIIGTLIFGCDRFWGSSEELFERKTIGLESEEKKNEKTWFSFCYRNGERFRHVYKRLKAALKKILGS